MAIALPDPRSLFANLVALERGIDGFEATRAAQSYTRSSSDSAVTVIIDGLGRIVSLTIQESQATVAAAVLAAKVKDTINSAIDQASAATATAIASFAAALGLPGLPAYGQPAPDYADFVLSAESLTAQIIANNPCQDGSVFSCEYGQVAAVVDAQRRVVTLTYLKPLPVNMFELAAQTMQALNCAIDDGTTRTGSTGPVIDGVIDSKGLADLVIYANGTLKLDDRVQVLGTNCNGFAAVANAGTGETNIGVEVQVGSVTSSAKVILRDRGKIHGYVQTASTYEPGADVTVDGEITQNGVVILPNLTLDVPFPGVTQGTIELEPDQTQTAAPGYFNQCHPKQNAQVFLSSGVYYFNDVTLEPDSKVWLNATNGPIIIWVKNSFTFRGQFLDSAGGFPRVFVGYLGTQMAPIESAYRGTLCAPNAKINLKAMTNPVYEGSFHAKDVEVQPDSRVCFHPFEISYGDLPGVGPAPSPTVDLGFETTQGWSCTQALLTSVTSPASQGSHSLQITNVTGSVQIASANFSSTVSPSGATRLLIDLWVPLNQPNPSNWGTFTILISIPSAGITNVSLGTVTITGRPQNQFSPCEFALPSAVQTALAAARSDVSLKLQLAITAGSSPWYLDNIRFAVPQVSPDVILSFEDVTKWSCSQVTITRVSSPKSHLQYSLKFTSVPSWFEIISVAFSSATLSAPQGTLKMDMWLPTSQPNPSWYGQVQIFVNVPSAGIYGASAGPVQLTSLPTGRFNTLTFTLPANVVSAINGTYDDVSLKLTFSLPSGAGPYYIDNIRFV